MATQFQSNGGDPALVWRNRIAWVVQGLLILAFGAAGISKLVGVQQMVDMFGQIDVGQWFRYMTGIIEVGSALLLLSNRTAWIGAGLLICTMVGAVYVHLAVVPSSPLAAIVLGALAGVVLYLRRPAV